VPSPCGIDGGSCPIVYFTLENCSHSTSPGCISSVTYLPPCVTSHNLCRKSPYRYLRDPNADYTDTTFVPVKYRWASFTCPSYVCVALTCICSLIGGACEGMGEDCTTSLSSTAFQWLNNLPRLQGKLPHGTSDVQ